MGGEYRIEDSGRVGNKFVGFGFLEVGDWIFDVDSEFLLFRAKK